MAKMMSVDVMISSHIQSVFAFSSKEWATEKNDAWLYGIFCGWDDDSLGELKIKFGWDDRDIEALRFRRKQFLELELEKI